jgi:hypothetical protein
MNAVMSAPAIEQRLELDADPVPREPVVVPVDQQATARRGAAVVAAPAERGAGGGVDDPDPGLGREPIVGRVARVDDDDQLAGRIVLRGEQPRRLQREVGPPAGGHDAADEWRRRHQCPHSGWISQRQLEVSAPPSPTHTIASGA